MRFLVFSRAEAERLSIVEKNCTVPHLWISFCDPSEPITKLPTYSLRRASIFFSVDDCDLEDHDVYVAWMKRKIVAFQPHQADNLVAFVNKFKDEVDLICVNCEAGVSRSSATAMALSLWLNNHDSGIGDSSYYHPNIGIKSLILRSCGMVPKQP